MTKDKLLQYSNCQWEQIVGEVGRLYRSQMNSTCNYWRIWLFVWNENRNEEMMVGKVLLGMLRQRHEKKNIMKHVCVHAKDINGIGKAIDWWDRRSVLSTRLKIMTWASRVLQPSHCFYHFSLHEPHKNLWGCVLKKS